MLIKKTTQCGNRNHSPHHPNPHINMITFDLYFQYFPLSTVCPSTTRRPIYCIYRTLCLWFFFFARLEYFGNTDYNDSFAQYKRAAIETKKKDFVLSIINKKLYKSLETAINPFPFMKLSKNSFSV